MEAFTRYILISTFCLSVLYLAYLLFQERETRLHQLRYFLIFSITLSLFLPLSTYRIDLKLPDKKYELEEVHYSQTAPILIEDIAENPLSISHKKDYNWSIVNILFAIYFLGVSLFGLRLLVHLTKILYLFWTSNKEKQGNIVLISSKTGSPFTFFSWIFIPHDLEKEVSKDIITHERIHASQYHSIDLILIELLSAVMWFNPLVWMMKKSVQLVHEYLADEGVLNTGTDKLRYQALLLNQIAEERLICLSSSFNHSLIKKRMIMMTKSKFNQGSKLKILTLIPLATILFLGVACLNGQEVNKNPDAYTVIVDAGHGGKDPGAMLNDKILEKDLSLSIAKILKEKASTNAELNVILTRENDEFLELSKRVGSNADLFISIHSNFSENADISGIECFIAKDSNNKIESKEIGNLIVSELNQLNGINTSLKEANFLVLRESDCPALLLNIGYISNSNDLAFITDKNNQGLICDKILKMINQLN